MLRGRGELRLEKGIILRNVTKKANFKESKENISGNESNEKNCLAIKHIC